MTISQPRQLPPGAPPRLAAPGVAWLACLIFCLWCSTAWPARFAGKPGFVAETHAFVERDTLKAFAYLEIPVRDLFFAARQEGTFEAVVDINVLIFEEGFQVVGDSWRHRLRAESLLSARNSPRALRKTVRFAVPPGDYEVEIGISQPEAGTGGKLRLPLKAVARPGKEIEASSILFGVCPEPLDGPARVRDDPVLGRRFGNPLPSMCFYTQIFHTTPAPGDSLEVTWRLMTMAQAEVRSGSRNLASSPTGVTDVIVELPLEDLWMGTYELELVCRLGKWKTERRASFEMDETRVSMGADFQATVDMVRIIADDEEVEKLEDVPAEDRQRAWDEFWKGRDPTPDTVKNEFKEEFFRRVRHANRTYGVLEPGWRSDRGRIYIRYGQPDQIETFPQNIDSPPYEIWDYFRLRARFVFVDYEGFGRYELYEPGRPARSSR